MITAFWDCEGVILVGAMLRRETINSDTYIRTQEAFEMSLASQASKRNLASA